MARRLLAAATLLAGGLLAIGTRIDAQAVAVTRGPYLQQGTATAMTVRWRTAGATNSVVRYGLTPDALTFTATRPALTTEHQVTLTDLAPHTRYFYAIGSTAGLAAGGDLGHTFTTAPPAGAVAPVRLWVLGDSGTANATARAVRDAYAGWERLEQSWGTQLVLMLGDNAYNSGTDAEYQTAVFDTFADVLTRVPLWPTLGNHDAMSSDSATGTGPYYDAFTLPAGGEAGGVPSGTEAYYSFDYANVHIICLDSADSDRSPTGAMVRWLQADLAASRAEWTIAFFHHAPYSRGTHDSDRDPEMREMREHVLPVLEAGGVDLVLAGHSHTYERTKFISGHYGPAATYAGAAHEIDGSFGQAPSYQKTRGGGAGAVYVTTGSAGQAGTGPLDHPAMRVAFATAGSMFIDIDGASLRARYLRDTGVVHDGFDIDRMAPSGPPGAPWGLAMQAVGEPHFLQWRSPAGGGRVDGYRLEAGTAPGRSDVGMLNVGNTTVFSVPRQPGRYFVRLRAFNGAGLGPPSDEIVITMGGQPTDFFPAKPPGTIAADVAGDVVRLSWRLPAFAVYPDRLEVGSRPGLSDLGVLTVSGGRLDVGGVPPGVYYVRVRRSNLVGTGPPSLDTQIVVGGVPSPPGRPGRPRAAVSGQLVQVSWAPPVEPAPITRYWLEAGTESDRFTVAIPTSGAAPQLSLAGVPPGVYYITVRAENAVGRGVPPRETRLVVP